MKNMLEKDIFYEMIVAHEIPFHMYDTKISGIAYKMIGLSILLPLTSFHKHREHFVDKCMAFHSTNGYWKDWLVLLYVWFL